VDANDLFLLIESVAIISDFASINVYGYCCIYRCS